MKAAPPIFAIGDVQGCQNAHLRLLDKIHRIAASPRLWYVGDLVNRGEDSAGVLRTIKAMGDQAVVVLGNHDLHLLAMARGLARQKAGDTMDSVLHAPDRDELLHWLQRRPLVHGEAGHVLVHAGLPPQWSGQQALALGAEVADVLADEAHAQAFFTTMYGNEPARWHDALQGRERLRFIVNACTRLRYCTPDGTLDFLSKEHAAPRGHQAWFDVPVRRSADSTVVFGHWAAMGLVQRPGLVGCDTGCVWGRQLSAVNLASGDVVQVEAK